MSFPTDFLIDLSNTDLYFFSHNAIYGRRMLFYINVTAKKGEFSISIQVIEYRTMGFISFIPLNFNWYKPVTDSCKNDHQVELGFDSLLIF